MPAEPPFDPDAFSGVVRLFPLPQVVSFPHVVTPLHVFEERYRSLTADALDSDGLITMAILKPGWESEYAGRPPLWPIGCLGKIVSHHTDQQGRHNLLLLGLRRVRLLEELDPVVEFRRSRVELIEEVAAPPETDGLRARLIELLDEGKVLIQVAPRHPGVDLPAHLRDELAVGLALSRRFGLPVLELGPLEVRASLSFHGERYLCVVPWMAVFSMRIFVTAAQASYPDSLPPELMAGLALAQAERDEEAAEGPDGELGDEAGDEPGDEIVAAEPGDEEPDPEAS
ncbi:MAG: LON peptidase substrate-binding domain-containing protein, partial [Planctomycetales bacterium]|nr:LON peptidase substrate-binding domain-containing protein [Planctomycetales bacterium]